MRIDPGLASWLRLTLTPGIGSSTLRALLRDCGLPEVILAQCAGELGRRLSPVVLESLYSAQVAESVQRTLDWAACDDHFVVTLADPQYPQALLEVPDPPTVIYGVGRIDLLQSPSLAIVGSRNASAQGERNAYNFAKALSDAGLAIVSGLALGIDAAAHRGALAGAGSTIAVLGTGVDVAYPSRNASLANEIGSQGLLISEFPLGTPPAAHHFPRRNRLISGLSKGCLVVEAALASGSLITARAAADQGREVFALPGSIHSPLSKGCHALIKSGAKLVESAEDVLTELYGFRPSASKPREMAGAPSSEAQAPSALLDAMGHDPVDVDTLCLRTGMAADRISGALLRLELDGSITTLPGGLYQRLEKGDRR